MNKGVLISIFLLLTLFVSVFVSAIYITGQITGNSISDDANVTCTDSEEAFNPNIKGTVSLSNGTILEDTCCDISNSAAWIDTCSTTKDTVIEYYCSGGEGTHWGFAAAGCGYGYKCEDGACVPASDVLCTDSDGGVNLKVKGTATDSSGTETDYCYADGALAEYSCLSNYAKKRGYFNCPSGYKCDDGACVPASNVLCTDSDGGFNLNVRGTTTDSSGSSTDFCFQNNEVTEYSCLNDYSKEMRSLRCGGGEICIDGACVINSSLWENSPCNDSDGGNNIYVRGETKTTKEESDYKEHVDECKSGRIDESACNYLGIIEIYMSTPCPQGFICNDGACVTYSNQTYQKGNVSIIVNSKIEDITQYSPPNLSIEQAMSEADLSNSQIENIELIEDSGELVYSVSENKQAKLFGIIPVSVRINNRISTKTGGILSIEKPWWSFLVSGL